MTKKELLKALEYTHIIFNNFVIPKQKDELDLLIMSWYSNLGEFDLAVVITAIEWYARNNNFVNVIQIKTIAEELQSKKNKTFKSPDAYFDEIQKAISYSNCKTNFEKLSDFAKEIVGDPSKLAQWSNQGEIFWATTQKYIYAKIERKLEEEKKKLALERNEKFINTTLKKEIE